MDPVITPERGDTADQLPRHTTPTWEVELLISGVAVFAMLQLPGWLDDRWFALRPRLDLDWLASLQVIYFYAKGASLILAVTFVAHLLLRARWIAQVGMHSVHPDGIRWDKLQLGPVQRELEQHQYGSAEQSIDRADNQATTVFAIGVMLASTLIGIAGSVLVGIVVLQSLSDRFGWRWNGANVMLVVFALLVVPVLAANRTDRAIGHALPAGGVRRRIIEGVFRFYGRLGIGRGGHDPTLALVASHAGRLRTGVLTAATFLLALGTVGLSYHAQHDPTSLGQYGLFPRLTDPGRHVEAEHYADARNPDRDDAVPYIQSAVVTGPYLQLVVPYRPALDADAMHHCPVGTRSSATPDARAESALACLQRLHAIVLDGAALPNVRYDIGSDPSTNRPALIAMLDVRALAAGRHELRIEQPPAPIASSGNTAVADVIAFWR